MEIHFLELPKLAKHDSLQDVNNPILDWLKIIDAKSKEGWKVSTEK